MLPTNHESTGSRPDAALCHHPYHVNAIFWKFYGWIDTGIEDWKAANGVTGEPHLAGNINMQPMPDMVPLPQDVHPGFVAFNTVEHIQNVEQATQIIAQTGVSRPRFLIEPSLLPEA